MAKRRKALTINDFSGQSRVRDTRTGRMRNKGGAIVPSPGGALAEVDPGYQTSGKVGQGRKRSGVGSGSPLDVRAANVNKLQAIQRLIREGVGATREAAQNAYGVLQRRMALRQSRNPNAF